MNHWDKGPCYHSPYPRNMSDRDYSELISLLRGLHKAFKDGNPRRREWIRKALKEYRQLKWRIDHGLPMREEEMMVWREVWVPEEEEVTCLV